MHLVRGIAASRAGPFFGFTVMATLLVIIVGAVRVAPQCLGMAGFESAQLDLINLTKVSMDGRMEDITIDRSVDNAFKEAASTHPYVFAATNDLKNPGCTRKPWCRRRI